MDEVNDRDTDREIVAQSVAGSDDAFTRLYHRFYRDVYRVARAVIGEHETALDAVQDTFIKVHKSLSRWNGDATLRTWIIRIAIRAAIDGRRRSSRHRGTVRQESEPSHDPRPALDQALLLDRVRNLSIRVAGQQGLILRLRLFGRLTNREIAETLGLKEPNVRMQLTKAIRRLREML